MQVQRSNSLQGFRRIWGTKVNWAGIITTRMRSPAALVSAFSFTSLLVRDNNLRPVAVPAWRLPAQGAWPSPGGNHLPVTDRNAPVRRYASHADRVHRVEINHGRKKRI